MYIPDLDLSVLDSPAPLSEVAGTKQPTLVQTAATNKQPVLTINQHLHAWTVAISSAIVSHIHNAPPVSPISPRSSPLSRRDGGSINTTIGVVVGILVPAFVAAFFAFLYIYRRSIRFRKRKRRSQHHHHHHFRHRKAPSGSSRSSHGGGAPGAEEPPPNEEGAAEPEPGPEPPAEEA